MGTVVKNLRLEKAENDTEPYYKWNVVSEGKTGTFYTDQNGLNIWQEDVAPEKTHIYNARLIDQFKKTYSINVKDDVENINNQLQGFADSGFFDKYLR